MPAFGGLAFGPAFGPWPFKELATVAIFFETLLDACPRTGADVENYHDMGSDATWNIEIVFDIVKFVVDVMPFLCGMLFLPGIVPSGLSNLWKAQYNHFLVSSALAETALSQPLLLDSLNTT
jgi:hypothetical protein